MGVGEGGFQKSGQKSKTTEMYQRHMQRKVVGHTEDRGAQHWWIQMCEGEEFERIKSFDQEKSDWDRGNQLPTL